MSENIFSQIQQERSAIMKTPEMEAHIARWGFPFVRAKVLVVNRDGKFLVVEEKRARIEGVWRSVRDFWNFPGGSMLDPTENILYTASREVLEETKHDIVLTGFIGVEQRVLVHDPCVTLMFTGEYRGDYEDETKINSKEIWRAVWLTEAEIRQLLQQGKMRSYTSNTRMLDEYPRAADLSFVTFR